ncbi:voltage-dependent T-type calcium channel subunit alpha-1I-like [Kryptolebias marmoratus]|uniref:voltage-dependent T-type calcium channel subunit alpha-1I-like n=1 Tax=Kryptolebias marmoratus TaxID=37003 RepID=UPI0018ACCC10|nr:voltage-dependent T-type calcium channel subunit alpha-1I-like [Kryptolebias marmoratus]
MNLVSKLIIMIVSVSQSLLNPCEEEPLALTVAGALLYVFFFIEMVIKMSVRGVYKSQGSYLKNNWYKLDALILVAETMEYFLHAAGIHLGVCQVLRPLRLVSRDKHLRNLITTILKIFPMVMNILVLFVFVIFVFGLLGVQLWGGDLRNRCTLGEEVPSNYNLSPYFKFDLAETDPFICSVHTYGTQQCSHVPPFRDDGQVCLLQPPALYRNASPQTPAWMNYSDCVNWNLLYNVCRPVGPNPYMGSINFDNAGYAWITVFQVVTLEGWADIMYYVMDASSYWSFLFFILVTGFGAFIILNTCTVIIATHFSETLDEGRDEEDEIFVFVKNVGRVVIGWLGRFWSRNIRNREQTESSRSGRTERGQFFRLRRKLRDFVEGQFTWVMMITIILNVITMAVEHHNQPEMLTQALYVCNVIFTVLFVVELVLNLIVSQLSYFLKWENIFDFIIVIISNAVVGLSLVELSSGGGGMAPVFRVFRVVRFVKLLHFLPYLRRQLLVLKRTIKESASLCWLVLFFIYNFSVFGMTLFSCQFVSEDGNLIDDRKNFDSLLWAMVTVFQIMTQEDWNFVLYNAMASTSPFAALYFVVIIVLGNNILLNILVGIVVESFQAQPKEHESGDEAADPSADSNILTAPENGPETNLENTQDDVEPAENTPHNGFLRTIQPVRRWYREHENRSLFLFPPENK